MPHLAALNTSPPPGGKERGAQCGNSGDNRQAQRVSSPTNARPETLWKTASGENRAEPSPRGGDADESPQAKVEGVSARGEQDLRCQSVLPPPRRLQDDYDDVTRARATMVERGNGQVVGSTHHHRSTATATAHREASAKIVASRTQCKLA